MAACAPAVSPRIADQEELGNRVIAYGTEAVAPEVRVGLLRHRDDRNAFVHRVGAPVFEARIDGAPEGERVPGRQAVNRFILGQEQ